VIPINPEAIGDPNQTPVVYLGEEAGKALGIPQRYWIAVSAVVHPVRDEWVDEQAAVRAGVADLVLGEYLGREDVLPNPAGLCCHVYAALTEEENNHDR
jgi:hypothetical protein